MSYLNNEKIKRVLPDNIKFGNGPTKPVKGADAVTQPSRLRSHRREQKVASAAIS